MTLTPRLRALALAGLVAGAFAALGAAAPGAQALTVLTCPGTSSVNYSPPITNTPATVTISGSWVLGPCVNALNPLELGTGGSSTSRSTPGVSCTALNNAVSGTRTISWSTGGSSTYTFNQTASDVAGVGKVVVQHGTIVAGEFAGDAIVVTNVVAAATFLNCGTTGVTNALGVLDVTITG